MDNGYFLIRVIKNFSIELYYFSSVKNNYIYKYPICFCANDIYLIIDLISLHDLINTISFTHLIYLGKELYKAELSIFYNQIYIQE
uniref:DUF4346 domain-containing protein n=1 Tax=Dasya naccarioides TaxID=2007180 RepID=A0A1Z1MH44_9FLOR|nr:hypothetical protein [Dasya naccarioides]ARW65145.1 hypothetical protein [Dasya naccarioides]